MHILYTTEKQIFNSFHRLRDVGDAIPYTQIVPFAKHCTNLLFPALRDVVLQGRGGVSPPVKHFGNIYCNIHCLYIFTGGETPPLQHKGNVRSTIVGDDPRKHCRLASLGAVAMLCVSSSHQQGFTFPRKRLASSPTASRNKERAKHKKVGGRRL